MAGAHIHSRAQPSDRRRHRCRCGGHKSRGAIALLLSHVARASESVAQITKTRNRRNTVADQKEPEFSKMGPGERSAWANGYDARRLEIEALYREVECLRQKVLQYETLSSGVARGHHS